MGARVQVGGFIGGIAAGILAMPAAAHARELDVRTVPGCPTADDVARAIEKRAPAGRDAQIRIETTSAGGYRGEIVLGEGSGRLTRSVAGRSCAAVVDALGLVVALDGDGKLADASADANADADADANANANEHEDEREHEDASARAVSVAFAGDPDAAVPAPPSRRDWSAGAAVSTTSFIGGDPVTGLSLFGDVRRAAELFGLSFMQPSARLSIGRTLQADIASLTRPDVKTHFQLTYASLEACPLGSTFWHDRFTTATCARADLGALDADTGNGATETRLWSTVGGMSRMRFALTSIGTWRPTVDLSVGLLAPLVRDRFHVLDDPALRAPSLLYTASVGLGVVFP